MTTTSPSVADFLTTMITASGKTQKEIATELGYDNPNIITMFKQGSTRLPLTKVGPMAIALDVDPLELFRLALGEYAPDTLIAIDAFLSPSLLTKNERELIDAFRSVTKGTDATAVIADARDVVAFVMV